jgi:PKD repeat protein
MVRNGSKSRINYSFLFRYIFLIFLTFIFQFFFTLNSLAVTQVSLVWDPNTETDVAGYRIFTREQSQSYDYTNPSWEGTDTSCTIYNLDETKTYCFVARAFDTLGNESADSAEVCQAASPIANQLPTANAGPDQTVNEGQKVLLNGSGSTDPDGGILSYQWLQTGGPAVTLSDPAAPQPTFTAPDVGQAGVALAFELAVVNQGGNQAKDTCVVNVTWQNEPPQANAGPVQTVTEGNVVTLDGSSSVDIDGAIASYLWKQTGGPTVSLSNASKSQATFTTPNVGPDGASLSFNLTVTDAGGLQNTDSCVVNVSWQNQPPTAVVTPDYLETEGGALVSLDGSKSTDPDDGVVSYLWTQVNGEPVTLSDPTSAVTTFVAPKSDVFGKNLNFRLTVKDRGGLQSTADSTIYVSPTSSQSTVQSTPSNTPPTADFSYDGGSRSLTFTDLSVDTDGTIVLWSWNFGDGKTSTSENPDHRYRRNGTYTVTLTVTDNDGASSSRSKTITTGTTTTTITTGTTTNPSKRKRRWR